MKIGDKVKVIFPWQKDKFEGSYEIVGKNEKSGECTIEEMNSRKRFTFYSRWLILSENNSRHPHTKIFL